MELTNLQSTVMTKDGRRVDRFGIDPHPVPVATDDLDPATIRMPPDPESTFDVEAFVSASALVAMLVFIAILLIGAVDAGPFT